MALISPTLDNRTYDQLKDELVRRIPVYAPEWTNHNESDPGIALVELFAHLGEALLYRFNQIPETARIEFLRLLGVRPRPAQPSRVMLAASTDVSSGVQVPRRSEAKAGSVSFETEDEVFVWPLDVIAAGKTPTVPDTTRAGRESSEDALARAKITDPATAEFYRTTIVSEDPLQPDPTLVDVSAQVDQAIWIALLAKPATEPTELDGKIVFIGVAFNEDIDPPVALEQLDAAAAEAFHATELTRDPPPMLWRLWQGAAAGAADEFVDLQVVADTTRGLMDTGVVKVQLPGRLPSLDPALATGGADSPPPLADARMAARVLAWIQVSRPASSDIGDAIGSVRWVGVNAVSAVQARTATTELVGTGTGHGGQRYPLTNHPVLPRSVELEVDEPAGWTAWTEVDAFMPSQPDLRQFVVDQSAGAIAFGRNRVPQIGERIRVRSYRYGGGVAGNVGAGAFSDFVRVGGVKVTNPLPAVGGADAANLADAMESIPAEVHRRDRAVTVEDFEDLARAVVGVSRADALPLLHPDTPHEVAAGVVSVVVFPNEDLRNPSAPSPDMGLLRRTARYLDARRLVTTELYVIPPEYVKIAVSVGLQVRAGFQVDAVRRWVELILRQYLAPLPPYGPDAHGWPLGRAVRRAELEAVAVQVDGVEYLEDLLLGVVGPSSVTQESLIGLERWQVPEAAEVTVVVGPPLAPGAAYVPSPPAKVPVPLPPDVC